MSQSNNFFARLKADGILCAEGYVFELERRGYVKAGAYVPEVVLEFPDAVRELHQEFARAGSDVTVALTYYAHREKLKGIGREDALEKLNRKALQIANKVGVETGTLVAANICNTWVYDPNDTKTHAEVRAQYTEQLGWAAQEGVDFVLAETLEYLGEALIALEVIKEFNLPSVINLAPIYDKSKDGHNWIEACKILQAAGANVVGFNCSRGPDTMLPMLRELRDAVSGPIAAVPVPYRTTPKSPAFQFLKDSETGKSAYTLGLDKFLLDREEMADFAVTAQEIGVDFIGICCGGAPHHVRAMAEAMGRTTPSSQYSPDLSQHSLLGKGDFVKETEKKHLANWV